MMRHRDKHWGAILVLLIFAAACTSTKEQAQKLLAAQQYDAAASTFEMVLRSSPLDAEAQVGLKKAREGVISTELLKVRSNRLSENYQQATKILESTLNKSDEWGVALNGAVASTMNEEIGYAVSFIKKELMGAIQEQKPMKGRRIELGYRKILGAAGKARAISEMEKDLTRLGLNDCKRFENEAQKIITGAEASAIRLTPVSRIVRPRIRLEE
jgi:hypothetical protein